MFAVFAEFGKMYRSANSLALSLDSLKALGLAPSSNDFQLIIASLIILARRLKAENQDALCTLALSRLIISGVPTLL